MSAPETPAHHASPALAGAVWHSLAWLVAGNSMGSLIAVLLLAPALNPWLGEWSYGRWMMVHMNTLLFGWCSLPMLGFLFKLYGAERGPLAAWCRPVLWLWSAALAIGSYSWLSGHSSGKLFLDWSGYARLFFPLTMGALWLLLLIAFVRQPKISGRSGWAAMLVKAAGLLVLLAVPVAIYFASNPAVYPVFNPDTGGPTGASQFESSLGIVFIVLLLPFGISRRKTLPTRVVALSWILFAIEAVLCVMLGRADISHRRPAQYLSLGTLLVWLPLVPAYYDAFVWKPVTRRWRTAMLWWWGGLVVTGWLFFLPGVLDRYKFTDGLVGHSLTAVAGFLTALLIFVMMQLLGEEDAWIFNRPWSFYAWNFGVLAYVVLFTVAGWIEGGNPAFTMAPGLARNVFYTVRLLTGLSMLAASVEWLVAASKLPALAPARKPIPVEVIAA